MSNGVPWNEYVRSQRNRSRSVSSSTEALDSDHARFITSRIAQHARTMATSSRSLPTNSPVPYFQRMERGPMSEGRLSDMGSLDVAFAMDMQIPSQDINLPRAIGLPEGMVHHHRNENDIPIASNIPNTPGIPETEATGTEARSPRPFLPNGSPPRPTATATCGPRTWVQCISEGQINESTPDDACSSESDHTGTSAHMEEVPEELGWEWRILHPFEIPGVQFPTDATPPNQRRLADNDALVELIQTTEYLKDTPMWGQRDYQLYPLSMGITSIEEEEEVEVEEDEIGLLKDLQRDQMEE